MQLQGATVSLQIGVYTPRAKAMTQLAACLLAPAAHAQLRTQRQLGYTVTATYTEHAAVCGLSIAVVTQLSPDWVLREIDEFVDSWASCDLMQLTPRELAGERESLDMSEVLTGHCIATQNEYVRSCIVRRNDITWAGRTRLLCMPAVQLPLRPAIAKATQVHLCA
jgi:secreted Zn-dependent insulinase-like peptidase